MRFVIRTCDHGVGIDGNIVMIHYQLFDDHHDEFYTFGSLPDASQSAGPRSNVNKTMINKRARDTRHETLWRRWKKSAFVKRLFDWRKTKAGNKLAMRCSTIFSKTPGGIARILYKVNYS